MNSSTTVHDVPSGFQYLSGNYQPTVSCLAGRSVVPSSFREAATGTKVPSVDFSLPGTKVHRNEKSRYPTQRVATLLHFISLPAYRFGLPQGIWLGPWGHVDLKKPVDDPST